MTNVEAEIAENLADSEFQFPIEPQGLKTNFSLYCRWCDYTVGLDEHSSESAGVTIFPSPASNYIHLTSNHSQISEVGIFDIRGRLIEWREAVDLYDVRMEIADLVNGIYLTHIALEDGTVVIRRFVKE